MKDQAPLPLREGVAPSYTWLPPGSWPSLLAYLAARFPAISAARWHARLAAGEVRAASGEVLGADAPYRAGLQVFYYREVEDEPAIPFAERILYEDADLLVADKPHFLPVAPSGRFLRETLLVRLRQATGLAGLAPLHRLDRETAGIVVFSKDPRNRGRYQALFRERQVDKVYEAVAPACPALQFPLRRVSRIVPGERFFTMQETGGEPNAITDIEVARGEGPNWLYRLRPITGKTHQLRLHMLGLGVPILHDLLYPVVFPVGAEDYQRPLQLLAKSLAFTDPVTGARHCFTSSYSLEISAVAHGNGLGKPCTGSSNSCAAAAK